MSDQYIGNRLRRALDLEMPPATSSAEIRERAARQQDEIEAVGRRSLHTAGRLQNFHLHAFERLATSTARRRDRSQQKVTTAFDRWARAESALIAAKAAADRARAREASMWADVASRQDNGPLDRRRRNLLTWLILLSLWALDLPIAVATFQVVGGSLLFNVLLAVVTDAAFLIIAYMAGIGFRRAQLSHDAGTAMRADLILALCLFALGVTGALTSGWMRWRYIQETATAVGPTGILITTILALATFLVAAVPAWWHQDALVAGAERAARRRRWAEWRMILIHRLVRRSLRQAEKPTGAVALAATAAEQRRTGPAVIPALAEAARSAVDFTTATWRKSSHSGINRCVEVAFVEERVTIRDSRDPSGPMLVFTAQEWASFINSVRNGEFDLGERAPEAAHAPERAPEAAHGPERAPEAHPPEHPPEEAPA